SRTPVGGCKPAPSSVHWRCDDVVLASPSAPTRDGRPRRGSSMRMRTSVMAALSIVLFVLAGAGTAEAATLTVTTSSDELTTSGQCSLRKAIRNANPAPRLHPDCVETGPYGADTITFQAGINPILTLAGAGEIAAATGDLDLAGVLTIQGNG